MPAPRAAPINMLAAALRYASLAWPVFPLHTPENGGCSCGDQECKSVGKHPRTKDGFKAATTDEARIRGWWRTWPLANIGVATGARSGFFVLDVDPPHGGDSSLALLVSEHAELPHTVEAVTGSGGRHVLFQHPGQPVPNSTQRLGKGLDVRGDGGYIVVAPSLHRSTQAYRWQPQCAPGDCDLATAPEWLLELLRPRSVLPQPGSPQASSDRAYERARQYIARMPSAISGAGGHQALWNVTIAVVRGFRLSESEALSLVLSDYNPRCDPPWSEKEVLHKIRDAQSNAQVPYGYLLDDERTSPRPGAAPPPSREPGSDDGDEKPAVKKSRLSLVPVSVLLAEQIPPTEWLIEPWLETGSIAALVAPPSIGKTLLAFWFATQVKGKVAIIEEEGGKRGFQTRIRRALAAAPNNKDEIFYSFKPRISLMNRADVLAMSEELRDYKLVVIDSLARACTGVDENDTKEMGLIVLHLDYLREKTGATSLSIHHTGKSKWKPGEIPRLEDGRGSSALAAGIDTVLALSPLPDDEHERGVVSFALHMTKQRDEDAHVPPKIVKIAMVGPSAEVLMEDKEPKTKSTQTERQRKVADILHLVLSAIPEPPSAAITREMVQEKVRKQAEIVRDAVNLLIAQGKVEEGARKRLNRVPSRERERSE